MSIHRMLRLCPLALVAGFAFSTSALAEGEGTANYMPDRVAEVLMQQAAAAGMTACEVVLVPTATPGTFTLTYRRVTPGAPQVARPANSMTGVVQSASCPR